VDPGTSKRRFRVPVAAREPPPVACGSSEVELLFAVVVLMGLLPLVVVDDDDIVGGCCRPRPRSSQQVDRLRRGCEDGALVLLISCGRGGREKRVRVLFEC